MFKSSGYRRRTVPQPARQPYRALRDAPPLTLPLAPRRPRVRLMVRRAAHDAIEVWGGYSNDSESRIFTGTLGEPLTWQPCALYWVSAQEMARLHEGFVCVESFDLFDVEIDLDTLAAALHDPGCVRMPAHLQATFADLQVKAAPMRSA